MSSWCNSGSVRPCFAAKVPFIMRRPNSSRPLTTIQTAPPCAQAMPFGLQGLRDSSRTPGRYPPHRKRTLAVPLVCTIANRALFEGVDAIRQPGFLERQLRAQVANLANHVGMNAAEAIECDHGELTLVPSRAASIAATSIFFMPIMASKARRASSPPAASASVKTRGVICHDRPQRSLHQPHSLI